MMSQSKLTFLLEALFALVVSGACADTTLPAPQGSGIEMGMAGPNSNESLVLPPVKVVAPHCDPYTDLDWCRDSGDCMMGSASDDEQRLSGCLDDPPGGGGTPTCPYWDPTCAHGGGGTDPAVPCDPRYDPECHKPLLSTDSASIRTAIQRHLKPAAQFTDPLAAKYCGNLMEEFNRLFNGGMVFRGNSDTPPGDPNTDSHVALFFRETRSMHFEPSALDAANAGDPIAIRNILNSALHEAAHSLGYDHSAPLWAGTYDLYQETPFNLLSPGADSCIVNW